jgi:aldehyde dehydrogenase (NAD+)
MSQDNTTALGDVSSLVEQLHKTFDSGITRPLEWRQRQLDGIVSFLDAHSAALEAAMKSDLGRPTVEAWAADIGATAAEVKYLRKHVGSWMKPQRQHLPLTAQPASGSIVAEPLGTALVIAPWNYPVQLTISPLAAALAAGNTVALKPSELSPATSDLITVELPKFLDADAVTIFNGGPELAGALLEQRFDHIFFTGSTNIGRIVAEAAAQHLTPVTLELGGKSPVIVDDSANIEVTARRIAWGKWLNAGQTCVAPDYVLVSDARRDELVDAIAAAFETFGDGDIAASSDFGRIVTARHFDRLVSLLDGQEPAFGGDSDRDSRYFSPTIVVDPSPDSALMSEEIFGPILPVLTIDSLATALDFVRTRPKPLALYVFTEDGEIADQVIEHTSSGGVCVNQVLMHITPPNLPFGGVGESGMGTYHGRSGFETFSHLKSVMRKGTRPDPSLMYPPYSSRKERIIRWAM